MESLKIENEVEAIGQRLREVRGEMTQAEFAEKLGIDRQSITRYEAGKRVPDALLIKKLIEMNVNAHWLLTGQTKSNQMDTSQNNNMQMLQNARSCLDLVIANIENGKE